ncbi:uncharacterized protein E0L32_009573 [Thyridium curvatum]|uniref:Pre-mRNA-splicing factor n=1 Tax=Thyridium curvatum TaxID=1093900 RepID=A0A507AR61_9PEZI|nr:uncharacterized protein E0L32_009573 [Thyridium curvatum]TPX08994.1 hypothetical protein E0L32_009573 [Thyridium curvatum]
MLALTLSYNVEESEVLKSPTGLLRPFLQDLEVMSGSGASSGARIAIKFGTPTSDPSKRPSRPPPPSALGKRPRQHHALDGDSESEEEENEHGRHEKITGFGENGSETDNGHRDGRRNTNKVLIIERQENRDWRSEARARRDGRNHRRKPSPEKGNGAHKEVDVADQDKLLHWGLTVKKKSPPRDDVRDQVVNGAQAPVQDGQPSPKSNDYADDPTADPDREAMDALLGKSSEKPTKDLVIERSGNENTEDSVFRRDFRDAPDESTLDDYEAMPVEEFGAALLRGMGWDGKPRGPKPKEVKRRANQLGLGAKELKGNEDLGAWNQKGGSKSRPRLNDYKREEEKRRERRDERYHDSYKRERERERASERDRYRHRDRHH